MQSQTPTPNKPIILFYGHHPISSGYHCFSNFFPCTFTVDGVKYNSSEQYFMAQKALLFKDRDYHIAIMENSNPLVIKNLGRQIRNFNQTLWDANCYNIMKKGVLAKFQQNPSLAEVLLSTKDALLAEASPYDRIWGIGLSRDDSRAQNPSEWKGTNYLGKVLMEVRTILSA